MSFESPEKMFASSAERGPEKINNYLEKVSQELREAGFPVTEDCRIDMKEEVFQSIYPPHEIKRDKRAVEELKERWEEEGRKKSEKRDGERLEKLTVAIFHKFLGDRFFVCRTSCYDDEKHTYTKYGVDTILFNKKTGDPVCAFDEVADIENKRYQRKKEEVLEMNLTGGGRIKYGLDVIPQEEKITIKPARLKELPVFYIALPSEALRDAEEKFVPFSNDESEDERKLFAYFINSIRQQIYGSQQEQEKGLKARELLLPPNLRKRLNSFEKDLKEINT